MGFMDRLRETLHLKEKELWNTLQEEAAPRPTATQLPQGNRESERMLPERYVQIQSLVGMSEARQFAAHANEPQVKEGVTTFTHLTDGGKLHLDSRGQFYSGEGKPIDRDAAYEQRLSTADSKASVDLPRYAQPDHMRQLESRIGAEETKPYAWKQSSGDIESYQNKDTGNYVHVDSTGRFYNQQRQEISQVAALHHADPERKDLGELNQAVRSQTNAHLNQYVSENRLAGVHRITEQDREIVTDRVAAQTWLPKAEVAAEVSRQALDGERQYAAKSWDELKVRVGEDRAGEFILKQDSFGVKSYQHELSGNHVHFDQSGQFYNQAGAQIGRAEAIHHAVNVAPVPQQITAVAVPAQHVTAVEQLPAPVQEQSLSM